ncbi:MAG: hypothetical protein LBI15_03985 [Dysgonamonadaceae bacterium]|jgi:hypothetical protein|nr:hypothetical protein [Dysgonamonadaceae bacterium]
MKAVHIYFGAIVAIFLLLFSSCDKIDFADEDEEIVEGFRLIKTEFTEIKEKRNVFLSTVSQINRTYTNSVLTPLKSSVHTVFHTEEESVFDSRNPFVFDWIPTEGIEVEVPELLLDDNQGYIAASTQLFQSGIVRTPKPIEAEYSVEVPGRHIFRYKGAVLFCIRTYNFTFTIEGIITGTQIEIVGTWTHFYPLHFVTTLSELLPIQ